MKRTLLLGNGINQCTSSHIFSPGLIKERFVYQLKTTYNEIEQSDLKEKVKNTISIIEESIDNSNIEVLAFILYDAVKDAFEKELGFLSGNHEQRLKRYLKRIALNSIFINNSTFVEIEITQDIKNCIMRYNSILTLNYYEYWDTDKRAIYLHGKIGKAVDGKGIVGYEKCIFSPLINKPKSKSETLYPSEHLYPSKDLYPMGDYVLYKDLDGIDSIDIFGVSPYGDNELIEKIDKIRDKRIFVYNYSSNEKEIDEWNKKVNNAKYSDSKNIYNDSISGT
jgi:hypothetical protein